MKIRVAFLIRRLDRGGAERQLIELASGLDKRRFEVSILTFYAGGSFEREITRANGINLVCLNKAGRYDVFAFLGRLFRTIRTLNPHIVHGYMSGANELSLIAGRMCGARVIWGLRSSDLGTVKETLAEQCVFRVGALLSRYPDCMLANAESVRSFHAAKGYSDARITVIPNGIDTQRFSILPRQRDTLRREWGLADHDILIGRAARLHPMKDYPSFLSAAGQVSRLQVNAKFACIGDDTDCAQLRGIAAREGIADRIIWAGGRDDMPAVYNALDICVSSSMSGEGFPNAVAEPMACGTPCVATDVGDSALLIEKMGVVVPPSDPAALGDGIARLIASRPRYPREVVRERITGNFSSHRLVARTEAEFETLVSATGPGVRKVVAWRPEQ